MHARNILLFASVLLPVIGAPVPTKETNSIQQRSANVVSQLSSYVSKRDPLIERIPEKALSDIVFETKRDADAEDTPAVGGDDDFVEEEEEDDVIDLEVDSSEVDPTKRGLRGNSGAGGGKRSIRGNDGLSGDKRDIPEAMVAARGVRPGNGNNHKTRGVRPGSGNNPRGVRPKKGNNQRGVRPGRGNNPRGVRPKKGNNQRGVRPGGGNNQRGVRPGGGNNPRGVVRPDSGTKVGGRPGVVKTPRGVRPGSGNNHKMRGVRPGSGNNPRSSLVQRALEALFL